MSIFVQTEKPNSERKGPDASPHADIVKILLFEKSIAVGRRRPHMVIIGGETK